MDKPKVTPKDFFLWIGAMIALYVSVFSLIALIFQYIDYAFPDVLNAYYDPYSSAMRAAMAALFVLFPVFLLLMRFIRRDITEHAEKKELWVRRWVLFLTVFVAGATVIVDLITLINYFLGGDITTRFVLKVLVVLLVAGAGFMHFLADIWGYWVQYPQRARAVGWGAAVVVLFSIVSGFFIMGSPTQIRLYRFDDTKVSDLQSIQWQIVNFWQQKERLPQSLTELQDPISGYVVPVDPQSGAQYTYETTGSMSFNLCATFNAPTQPNSPTAMTRYAVAPVPVGAEKGDLELSTWQHDAGEKCFERTIDPERYPPYSKQKAL